MKILVYGAGSWGTALANVLADNNQQVYLYGNIPEVVDEINLKHTNSTYFGNETLINDKIIGVKSYLPYLNEVDILIIAVPTKAYREVLSQINLELEKKLYIVSVGKGFDPTTEKRLSETIRELIDESKRYPIVSLIGPSHAEEVILRKLTCLTSTCLDLSTGQLIQNLFSNSYFRVYTNQDEIGAEYAAASKNVIALASGMLAGLGYGDNSKAALITRGLAEIVRLGLKVGGKLTTFLGLTGIGDLMVTCTSYHSRNYQAGLVIGKNDSAEQFLKENKMTVEGIKTSQIIVDIAKKNGIELPVIESVYKVLYQNQKPSAMIDEVMNRPLKSEF